MRLILTNRLNPTITAEYVDPISIKCDRAGDIYNEDDIRGNGIKESDMVMVIALRGGELATFKADEWTVKIIPGEGMPKREFLSQEEVAEVYGVSRSTAHRAKNYLEKNRPEALRYLGHQVRISVSMLDDALKEKNLKL